MKVVWINFGLWKKDSASNDDVKLKICHYGLNLVVGGPILPFDQLPNSLPHFTKSSLSQ